MTPKSDIGIPKCAIVLAAGGASRFGSPKQLAEFEGTSLVRRACDCAKATGFTVVVVLGARADEIANAIEGRDLVIVQNHGWKKGIGSSLKCGLRTVLELHPETEAVLITLADQVLVDSESLRRLVTAFDGTAATIAAAHYNGTLGVPAILGCEHFDAVLGLEDSKGAAGIIRSAPDVVAVEMPEAATDIDTPDDLRAIHN